MPNSTSRLNKTPNITYDNQSIPGKWVEPSWLKTKLDISQEALFSVTSEFEGKPDLIANQIYGNPFLDWVLIAYNNAEPFGWPKAGSIIKYPIERVVYTSLLG